MAGREGRRRLVMLTEYDGGMGSLSLLPSRLARLTSGVAWTPAERNARAKVATVLTSMMNSPVKNQHQAV